MGFETHSPRQKTLRQNHHETIPMGFETFRGDLFYAFAYLIMKPSLWDLKLEEMGLSDEDVSIMKPSLWDLKQSFWTKQNNTNKIMKPSLWDLKLCTARRMSG